MAFRSTQRGMNAVELMTTLAIVGVLATVAMPGMSSMVAAQRLKAASSDLHTSLLLARSEAIKRNTPVAMTPSAQGWAGGWTLTYDGDKKIAAQGPHSKLSIDGPASVVYTGNGRVDMDSDAEPEFALSAESTDNVRCVRVDLSGRPSVKKTPC